MNKTNQINQINPSRLSRTSCLSRSQFTLMSNAGYALAFLDIAYLIT
jgi:hypothetical protein